ncbi:MAG: response regulator [Cyclobacteriaceae bacterium]|nr:response regulator [Cyclobacteriaceae bacterium]
MDKNKPILLVEDDLVDAMTVGRALKEVGITNEVHHVKNGEEAIDYLNNEENKSPSLIFLDLNMPVMSGLEFLKERADNGGKYKQIPIIVLTTSKDDNDIAKCFDNYVAGYMVKPVDFYEFVEMIKSINSYWTLSQSPEINA